ncbi:hypothetical protein EsH8_VI_000586 [Colletotrichum jinshuiense]
MANHQAENGVFIVADDVDADDTSSVVATSIASSSTSLASSILNHRIENGRTYHKYKEGRYNYPNDERENDRLDFQHELFYLTLHDKLGLAPPNDDGSQVKRVLDLGTGTGIWAIDFGDAHPEAVVYGVDLSPTQSAAVPPNVKFEIDDVEEPWTYHEPFDYIHCRAMTSSISNWRKLLKQAFNHLEPGGWFEMQEGHIRPRSDDGTLSSNHALVKWVDLLEEACNKFGRPFADIPGLADVMKEIGFVDVTLSTYKWPLNTWPKDPHYKELGHFSYENFMDGIEGFTLAPFTRALGWTKEEVNVFLVDVRNDLKDRTIHAYIPIQVVHGRRPDEPKESEEPSA